MKIEIIVRALIKNKKKVLFCKNLEKGHYYLPGGHVEANEDLISALKREFYEETGLKLKVKKFLGILENFFEENNKKIHEINFIFEGKINEKAIKSKENYIEFYWIDTKDWNKIKILPKGIKKFIKSKTQFLVERNV